MNEEQNINNAQQQPCTIHGVSGCLSIDDLHFKLRTIFFDKMKEHWVDDDMIHMDYVSDAFDETILLFLEDCH
jgi:ribosomal protein L25 (general stress protein Ctc)